VLSQRGVIGGRQSEVSYQPHDSLDQRPSAGRLKKFDKRGQTVVKSDCILSHLRLHMTTCQMTKGADCRLNDILTISSLKDGSHQASTPPT